MSQGSPLNPGTVPATVNVPCMSQEPGISMYPLIFGTKVMIRNDINILYFVIMTPFIDGVFSV
jgi:hypothetical protein|tara:strand:+ start:13081 stop:13269 length:189 start_codon:yes stop_codon:yes gene_type:complete